MAIWGSEGDDMICDHLNTHIYPWIAAAGGPYGAIAALVNIPAILFSAYLYEIFLVDSSRGG